MNCTSIISPYLIIPLLSIIFGLCSPDLPLAEEIEFNTGVIRVICGRDGGGFIDEVYLDRNMDGVYSDDERIVLRPEDQSGLFVSYTLLKDGESRTGVAVGPVVKGAVKVNGARVEHLEAVIKGVLDFGKHGSSPFEVSVRGRKKSAVLIVGFSFEPLRNADNLLLREAGLRIFGVFDRREPPRNIRKMSTGAFRNTPRLESASQSMVWQYGGHLMESPWYWRNWLSWSIST